MEGSSLLLYRGGKTALHAAPDGISRNPEGRDRLLLATQAEWVHWRDRIRGIEEAILAGECEDDDPAMLTIEQVEKDNPEALTPSPLEEGLQVTLRHEQGREAHFRKPASTTAADFSPPPMTTDRLPKSRDSSNTQRLESTPVEDLKNGIPDTDPYI